MDQKQIQIAIKFGDDSYEPEILKLNFQLRFDESKVEEMKKAKEFIQDKQNDLYLMIEFAVVQGRQKQAIQYLQKAMDEPEVDQINTLNPLQKLLTRPKSTGKVSFSEKPGFVIVNYCLYEEFTTNELPEQVRSILDEFRKRQLDPKINLALLIKGQQNLLNKQKTTIYPNYIDILLTAEKLYLDELFKLMKKYEILPEEFEHNPLVRLFGFGCRRAQLNFSFTHFRRIKEMYQQSANLESKIKSTEYIYKNILKNKIKIKAVHQNFIYGMADLEFYNENTLQRIIGVLHKSIERIKYEF